MTQRNKRMKGKRPQRYRDQAVAGPSQSQGGKRKASELEPVETVEQGSALPSQFETGGFASDDDDELQYRPIDVNSCPAY